jgi:arylsulfatase A-like enzyme
VVYRDQAVANCGADLLEGGPRIPAIVRWPARIRPGSVTDQVTITMDWLPTLLSAAAKPDPAYPPDGIDLLPTLTATRAQPVPSKLF